MAMPDVLQQMKQSFRSTFRDWAAESTAHPNHVVEQALAHTISNAVEAAYRRNVILTRSTRLTGRDHVEACSGRVVVRDARGIKPTPPESAVKPRIVSARPTTPVEIDGATHVWESPARYTQFRAPAFPRLVPCRSKCPALVSLARARTSDDIRPRALCTPLPKSSSVPPDLLSTLRNCCHGLRARVSIVSRRVMHFGANSDLCAKHAHHASSRSRPIVVASAAYERAISGLCLASLEPCDRQRRKNFGQNAALGSKKHRARDVGWSEPDPDWGRGFDACMMLRALWSTGQVGDKSR